MKKLLSLLLMGVVTILAFAAESFSGILYAVDNAAVAVARSYSVASLHDFHWKKEVLQKMYQTYGDGFSGLDMLRYLGRWGLVSNITMKAEEEGYAQRTITVGASNVSVAGAPGATASFELDADDLDTSNRYYPRVGFNTLFGSTANGFIVARITNIAASGATITLTVEPYDTTKTISATYLYAGVELMIGDSAFAVETGQPQPTIKGYFEREFYAQIMKETLTFGGMELAKKKWVEVEGIGFYTKELARAEFLLDKQEEATLIMGQPNTNSIVQASSISGQNEPVQTNKGVWTWIDQLGGEVNYTHAGGVSMTLYDQIAEYLESQGVTAGIVMILGGSSLFRRNENMGVEFISNPGGGASQGGGLPGEFVNKFKADGPNKPSMNIDIGFRGIKKAGLYFIEVPLSIFNSPFQMGIDAYMLKDSAMVIPLTKVKDRKSGQTIPNLMARYVGLGNYSRRRVIGTLAGMDGFANQTMGFPIISEIDGFNTYWLSHVMFPFMEANKSLLWKRTS